MNIGAILEDIHQKETTLIVELQQLSQRYPTAHEIDHVARDISRWSHRHVRDIARISPDYGLHLGAQAPDTTLVGSKMRETLGSVTAGQGLSTGLLQKLRTIYLHSCDLCLDWELLMQVSQAARDAAAFELASACYPNSVRQMKWAHQTVKTETPQIVLSTSA